MLHLFSLYLAWKHKLRNNWIEIACTSCQMWKNAAYSVQQSLPPIYLCSNKSDPLCCLCARQKVLSAFPPGLFPWLKGNFDFGEAIYPQRKKCHHLKVHNIEWVLKLWYCVMKEWGVIASTLDIIFELALLNAFCSAVTAGFGFVSPANGLIANLNSSHISAVTEA